MTRASWLAVVVLGLAGATQAAAPPVVGPVRLTAAQQKQIDKLSREQNSAVAARQFERGAALAKQLAELRRQWQGARHWQTVDAWLEWEVWQRLTGIPAADRGEVMMAMAVGTEAERRLSAQQLRDAERLARQSLAMLRGKLKDPDPLLALAHGRVAACLEA